ncbi:MAG: hypothetical protein IFNCLDLE_02118 [Ignavibacteriaceae bacterium]|nr:hypothetical protein [Ignavibacteriaceae bacterium]
MMMGQGKRGDTGGRKVVKHADSSKHQASRLSDKLRKHADLNFAPCLQKKAQFQKNE